MTPAPYTPGPNLALAQEAVAERIADNPRTVDWFGVMAAITDAHVRDLNANPIIEKEA